MVTDAGFHKTIFLTLALQVITVAEPKEAPGLEFPCTLTIKVFASASHDLMSDIRNILLQDMTLDHVLDLSTRDSRKGNYRAYSCKVRASSRSQLDRVFQNLGNHEHIVMVI